MLQVTYRSEGPNIDWKYLKKLHPAIPVIRVLCDHMEHQFGTLTRGKKHTVPKKETDVNLLRRLFSQEKANTYEKGRTIKAGDDKATDFFEKGLLQWMVGKVQETWHGNRNFVRSTAEEWNEADSDTESVPGPTETQVADTAAASSGAGRVSAQGGPPGAASDEMQSGPTPQMSVETTVETRQLLIPGSTNESSSGIDWEMEYRESVKDKNVDEGGGYL